MTISQTIQYIFSNLLSMSGRDTVRTFVIGWIVFTILALPFEALILGNSTSGSILLTVLTWGGLIGFTCLKIPLGVRRFHDIGLSGWYFIGVASPWAVIAIFFTIFQPISEIPYTPNLVVLNSTNGVSTVNIISEDGRITVRSDSENGVSTIAVNGVEVVDPVIREAMAEMIDAGTIVGDIALVFFIPIIVLYIVAVGSSLWVLICFSFSSGSPQANQYGAAPPRDLRRQRRNPRRRVRKINSAESKVVVR